MKLTLAFELDVAGLVQPEGILVLDLDFYAAGGRIHADVKEIEVCNNAVYTTLGQMFGRVLLEGEIERVINEVIAEMPQRDPRVRKLVIVDGPCPPTGGT